MMPTTPDAGLYRGLYSHDDILALFSDRNQVSTLLAVEASLATAQESLGIVPGGTASEIQRKAASFEPDWTALVAGTESNGVPVVELLAQFTPTLNEQTASHIHRGATSQDIVDCAQLLLTRSALDLIEADIEALTGQLATLADRHRRTLMIGRTRLQQAAPISFGLKVANWLAPVLRHRQRLVELRPRLFVAQLGGAAGTAATLGTRGIETLEAFARELGFDCPAGPWHSQRDTVAELAGWLSLVSGSLGKIGEDVLLMAQNEVGEIRLRNPGRSSAMPHKQNPVAAESLVALAALNSDLVSAFHRGMVTDHERPTVTWQMEWLNLPRMLNHTAAAVSGCQRLLDRLVIDENRMQANLDASRGLLLADSAMGLLTTTMSRTAAQRLVSDACVRVNNSQEHLVDALRALLDEEVDLAPLTDADFLLGSTEHYIDRIIARATFQGGTTA